MAKKKKQSKFVEHIRCIDCDVLTNHVCKLCGQGLCGFCAGSEQLCGSCQEDSDSDLEKSMDRAAINAE